MTAIHLCSVMPTVHLGSVHIILHGLVHDRGWGSGDSGGVVTPVKRNPLSKLGAWVMVEVGMPLSRLQAQT